MLQGWGRCLWLTSDVSGSGSDQFQASSDTRHGSLVTAQCLASNRDAERSGNRHSITHSHMSSQNHTHALIHPTAHQMSAGKQDVRGQSACAHLRGCVWPDEKTSMQSWDTFVGFTGSYGGAAAEGVEAQERPGSTSFLPCGAGDSAPLQPTPPRRGTGDVAWCFHVEPWD